MLRPIINTYIAPENGVGNIVGLGLALLVLAGVYLVGVAASYAQSKMMIGVSQRAMEKLRNDLFTKMQTLPVRYYDRESNGELMSRFTNDVDNVGTMMDSTVVNIFSSVLTLVGTLAMMLYCNIWLTLITVALVPLMMKAGGFIASRSRKYYSAQQAALGAVNGYIEESVSGQKVVKVFCHEEQCKEEFGLLNANLRGKQMKAQFLGGIMGPVMGNLGQVSYALVLCIGGILCALGRFDLGGLTIFVN